MTLALVAGDDRKRPFLIRAASVLLIASTLTLVTQVGGFVYLACLPLFTVARQRVRSRWPRRLAAFGLFATAYLFVTFAVVPIVAGWAGRVPLSVWGPSKLTALSSWTCVLNRHYVVPELKEALERVATRYERDHPDNRIAYLDASFPFFDGFPLLPHLSHHDGKKVDLAFFYLDAEGEAVHVGAPSPIGYGVYVEPRADETNAPARCARRGHWRYGALGRFVPQWWKDDFRLDHLPTRDLIEALAHDHGIRRIFLEPHLRRRLRIRSPKVRFHGCHAVRHDDHLHAEVR